MAQLKPDLDPATLTELAGDDTQTLDAAIAAFVSEPVREHLEERLRDVTDLGSEPLEQIAEQFNGTPVIVELARQDAPNMINLMASQAPETPLLVIGDDLPGSVVRAMLKMRATDVVSREASISEFSDSLTALLHTPESEGEEEPHGGTCHIFTGAVGGAGATTLAIEMACNLAARKPESGVCLIDLNLADGMVVPFLEGKAKLDLAGISEAPERVDEALLEALSWEHDATGLTLIAAPRDFEAHEHVDSEAILNVLDVACTRFAHVVVDLPRQRYPWTRPILAAGDEVVIVSEFTVPSLHAAADMARDIALIRDGVSDPKLILNRMSEGGRSFSVAKAGKSIGWPIEATIRSDWKAARAAVNLGMPIFSVQAKSPLVKDVEGVVETFVPTPEEIKKVKKKGFFR